MKNHTSARQSDSANFAPSTAAVVNCSNETINEASCVQDSSVASANARYLPRSFYRLPIRDEFAAVPEATINAARRKIRGSPPLTPDSMTK